MEPLAKIFGSPARLRLLRLFLFNQNTGFTLGEIADRAKLTQDTVRGELSDLLASGLIRKKGERVAAKYQVNPRFEQLNHLDTFIRETTSVRPQDILTALKRAGALRLVVLSGFFTGMVEPQIDLLIAGDQIQERVLAASVRGLEAELGREIRYASFATADFRYRRGVYDRLLRDVFDYPHRILLDKIGL
jgi:DNA-binding transcriptional ArsR family regulator